MKPKITFNTSGNSYETTNRGMVNTGVSVPTNITSRPLHDGSINIGTVETGRTYSPNQIGDQVRFNSGGFTGSNTIAGSNYTGRAYSPNNHSVGTGQVKFNTGGSVGNNTITGGSINTGFINNGPAYSPKNAQASGTGQVKFNSVGSSSIPANNNYNSTNKININTGNSGTIVTSNIAPINNTYKAENRTYIAPVTSVHQQIHPIRTGYYEDRQPVQSTIEHKESRFNTGGAVITGVTAGAVGATAASYINKNQLGQMQRPEYRKLYTNQYYHSDRKVAPVSQQVQRKSKCCGTPCWALLGCCGLLGVILGMLFGLGVLGGLGGLGGLNWFNGIDPNIDPNIHIGDLEGATNPIIIDDIEYPKDSISVTQTIINSTEVEDNVNPNQKPVPVPVPSSSGTQFQFPPAIPIPIQIQPNIENLQPVQSVSVQQNNVKPIQANTQPQSPDTFDSISVDPSPSLVQIQPVVVNVVKKQPNQIEPITLQPIQVEQNIMAPIQVDPVVTRKQIQVENKPVPVINPVQPVIPISVAPTSSKPTAIISKPTPPISIVPTSIKPTSVKPVAISPIQVAPIQTQPTSIIPVVSVNPTKSVPTISSPISSSPIVSQPISAQPLKTQPITFNSSQN